MLSDLDVAMRVVPAGELRFQADIPDGWQQGRGAFGGLVLGILARAMGQSETDPARTLRSLSGEILSPVLTGPVELRVEVLRRGSGLSSLAARLWQDGEVRAHATGLYAKTRLSDREYLGMTAPTAPKWQDVEPVPVEPPFGPDFARAFEYRNTGPLPLSGTRELACEGWVRIKHPLQRFDAPELVAYIDAWWPTAYANEELPRPMATIAFNFQLLHDPAALNPAEPLLYRARALGAHDGFISEVRELWTGDGRLVAVNPQTFVYVR